MYIQLKYLHFHLKTELCKFNCIHVVFGKINSSLNLLTENIKRVSMNIK